MRLSIVKVFAFLILIFERAVHPNNLMLPYFFFHKEGGIAPRRRAWADIALIKQLLKLFL
jgi:hypothetical protein